MADFTNLQIYGVPVITYGLVGLTTAILAYATSISSVGETIANTVSEATETPLSALSNMNPLSGETTDKKESIVDRLNPFSSTEGETKPVATDTNLLVSSETKGGKNRRKKTSKTTKRRTKRKNKKQIK